MEGPAVLVDAAPAAPRGSARERAAWCAYDFGNSAFTTIALTAFGAPYFQNVLIGPEGVDLGAGRIGGAAAWGLCISASMSIVTLSSPWLGALADRGGRKRAFLAVYTAVGVAATIGLGLLPPSSGLMAVLLYVVANVAFEGGYVFYNAFLPDLAPASELGRLSGLGWAVGYGGGLLSLALALPFVPAQYDAEHAAGASVVYFLTAGWWALFALPALVVLRDRPVASARSSHDIPVAPGLGYLRAILRFLLSHRMILYFLIAFFLFNDAITTVIEFTGTYTATVLAFTPRDNIYLFLVLNVIAAPSAFFFGRLLDRIGGVRSIRITLVIWVAVIVAAVLTTTKAGFWPVAILAAVVIGATQSSSRALMAKLAPASRIGELMGLLALSGKASAIFGPALYGTIAEVASTPDDPAIGHRIAIGAIGVLFVIAYFVMALVDEERGVAEARAAEAAPAPAASAERAG